MVIDIPACKKCTNLRVQEYHNKPYGFVKKLSSSSKSNAKNVLTIKNVKIVVVNVMMIYLHYLLILLKLKMDDVI